MTKLKTILALALLATLAGCESSNVREEFRIAEIKPIAQSKDVQHVWQRQVGDGVDEFFSNLAPAVAGKVVFAANREGQVDAFDLENGDRIWRSDVRENPPSWLGWLWMEEVAPAKVSGGITAAYGHIFIGTENGEVVALSQQTGDVIWRAKVKGEVLSAPAAGDGWIAVTTGAGWVHALHPDTGEERWKLETDVPALSLRGTSTPTIAGGGVLVGTATGKLSVIILDKGLPAWESAVGISQGSTELEQLVDVDTKPLIIGNTVYMIGYNGNLVALDMSNGRDVWKREYSSYRNLAVDLSTLYLTDVKGNVTAVDAFTGVEKWNSSELYNRRLTAPAVFKDTVVVGDFEGYIHFLNKSTGEIVARYQNSDWFEWFSFDEDGAYSVPVVADNYLVVQTRDGEVTVLSLASN